MQREINEKRQELLAKEESLRYVSFSDVMLCLLTNCIETWRAVLPHKARSRSSESRVSIHDIFLEYTLWFGSNRVYIHTYSLRILHWSTFLFSLFFDPEYVADPSLLTTIPTTDCIQCFRAAIEFFYLREICEPVGGPLTIVNCYGIRKK